MPGITFQIQITMSTGSIMLLTMIMISRLASIQAEVEVEVETVKK